MHFHHVQKFSRLGEYAADSWKNENVLLPVILYTVTLLEPTLPLVLLLAGLEQHILVQNSFE